MKAFLETSIVSALVKKEKESGAILQLLQLSKAGRFELVTSYLTHQEISKLDNVPSAEQDRWNMGIVYNLLRDVPYVEDHKVLGSNIDMSRFGGAVYPYVEDHPISKALHQIGLDRTDAHHLMLAILNKCDIFVTCDVKTILRYRSEIQNQFPAIKLMKPSELVAALCPMPL